MNSYFNIYGTSAGPIQIGCSGTWIKETQKNIGVNNVSTRHLTFALNKNDNVTEELVLLRGRTPVLGFYNDGDKKVPYCDLNSLVTAEWVMAYANLTPGDKEFDLNNYVTKTEFNILKLEVLDNKNNITTNKNDILSLKNELNEHIKNPFPSGIIIECGGANLDEVNIKWY